VRTGLVEREDEHLGSRVSKHLGEKRLEERPDGPQEACIRGNADEESPVFHLRLRVRPHFSRARGMVPDPPESGTAGAGPRASKVPFSGCEPVLRYAASALLPRLPATVTAHHSPT